MTAERKRRLAEESIRYYKPHRRQEEFHNDPARIRLVLGGNRSGKTQSGCAEDVAFALGYRPWLSPMDSNYKVAVRVPNKGLIVGESFGEQVKKVLVPKLLGDPERNIPGLLPKSAVKSTKKNQQGIITTIMLDNGSSMQFQSYDQEVDLFESTDYDWVHMDEPCPRPIWVAIQRGLTDRMGRSWMTMTPLKEAWIHDQLVSRDTIGKHFFDMSDNIGYGLKAEAVAEFARELTPEEREARIHGRFFHLSGLVYKEYQAVHKIERVPIDSSWSVYMHIDTHPRTPHHAVWIAVRPDNSLMVCGELKNSDPANLVEPFAFAVLAYERTVLNYPCDRIRRLIEPGSQTQNPVKDGRSIHDEFAEYGIVAKPGSKNRDAGILLLHKYLHFEQDAAIYPQIFFFRDLKGIDYEMRRYQWDDWAKKAAEGRTDKQAPKDKDDHFIEGIHRILLDTPRWEGNFDSELDENYTGSEDLSPLGY